MVRVRYSSNNSGGSWPPHDFDSTPVEDVAEAAQ